MGIRVGMEGGLLPTARSCLPLQRGKKILLLGYVEGGELAMKKFRKKPVVIEAVQYTGNNADEVLKFIGDAREAHAVDDGIVIKTLEGDHKASPNDWIIKGTAGEFYPCKPDIFAEIYEEC